MSGRNKGESKQHRYDDDSEYSSSLSSSHHKVKSSSGRKRSSSSKKSSLSSKRRKRKTSSGRDRDRHHHHDRKRSHRKHSFSSTEDDSSSSDDLEDSCDNTLSDHDNNDSSRKRSSRKSSRKEMKHSSSSKDTKKRSKKHDSKKEKKRNRKKKKSKRRRKEDKDSSSSGRRDINDDSIAVSQKLKRNYDFCNALHDLLQYHPELATELPIMLIRMAGGASFALPVGTSVSHKLEAVFRSLASFGVVHVDNSSWTWKSPDAPSSQIGGGTDSSSTELVLLKIARFLMDEIGITMNAVQEFEQREKQQKLEEAAAATKAAQVAEEEKKNLTAVKVSTNNRLQKEVVDLIETFKKQQKGTDDESTDDTTTTSSPSLAAELAGIINLIISGECISLDGLPDAKLRLALEYIFQQAGLEHAEIEDDGSGDDDDGDGDEGEPSTTTMGYGLPSEHDGSEARSNLDIILQTCRAIEMHKAVEIEHQSVVRGPSLKPAAGEGEGGTLKNVSPPTGENSESSDDDDDEGPAPLGASRNRKTGRRAARGPSMPAELVKAMADRRKREFESVSSGGRAAQVALDDNVREEWMLEPGQHELLQGIKSGGAMKNRTFKNEKNRGQQVSRDRDDVPLDPKVQAEMDAIKQAHAESRGPSLLDQHKKKVAEEKAAREAGDGKQGWTWNRDKNLDDGRRVDTNALNMVMGGASTELKSKFQGTFSRSFM